MSDLRVAVVTPTIGTQYLWECLDSIQRQTYSNLVHHIFIDGEEYNTRVERDILSFGGNNVRVNRLQDNIGHGQWYGHRIYAASAFLVNADIICYLDEDNWVDPEHIESLVDVIERGYDWAYSLRKICNKEGKYICNDDCESLGKWPIFNLNNTHIDTSCYGVKISIATKINQAWYGQWGADRNYFSALKTYFPKFECTGKYSVRYRLDGNPGSVTKEFFEEGNKINNQRYNGIFPWKDCQKDING